MSSQEDLQGAAVVCFWFSVVFGIAVGAGFNQLGVVDGFSIALGMAAGVTAYLAFGWLLAPEKKA